MEKINFKYVAVRYHRMIWKWYQKNLTIGVTLPEGEKIW